MNVFHWHLTDSHSFPIELQKYPATTAQMVNYGAYSSKEFYTIDQVKEIIQYANANGDYILFIIVFFLDVLCKTMSANIF
jgi:hexosaminidase